MNVYTDHARQLDALQSEQDDGTLFFVWNGSPWKILPGGAKFGRGNDIGGFKLSCDLMLTCTAAQFSGTLPQSGESMTYFGLEYTIKFVTTAPESKQIRVEADLNVAGM